MVIICGSVQVGPDRREEYVEAHRDLVRRARDADGCLHVAITADSVDPGRVNNAEVWRDKETLDAWRAIANAPDLGIELRDPDVARYDATDGGPLF